MHQLINPQTNEVISFQEFNEIHQFTTHDIDFNQFGLVEVQHSTKPITNRLQRLELGQPIFDGTSYYENWQVIDITTNLSTADLDNLKEKMLSGRLAELADYRYLQETKTISINGAEILMDRESRSTLMSAFVILSAQIVPSVTWKAVNAWVELTLNEIGPIAYVVSNYVKAVFEIEKFHGEAMMAITDIHELVDYDFTINWPNSVY